MKKMFQKVALISALFTALPALAVSPFDTLVAGVSFSDAQTAVLSVVLLAIGFSLVIGGGMLIYRVARRAGHRG